MKNAIRTFTCIGCGCEVIKSCTKKVKFCTPVCYHAHGKTGRRKTGEMKHCIVCEKEFYVPSCRVQNSITCSVKCSNIYQGRKKITLTCIQCGNTFKRSPSFKKQKYCSIECRNKNDFFKLHTLRIGAEQNKSKLPNKLEQKGYAALNAMNLYYLPQWFFNGKFTVDAFMPKEKVIIQFDGDYWHGNPAYYVSLDSRQKKRVALDKSQDAYLHKCGIKVIRFWESDFRNMLNIFKKLHFIPSINRHV